MSTKGAKPALGLGLNLSPLKAQTIASHQEETDALYGEPIDVAFVLSEPAEEVVVRCSLGEALSSFVERLVVEHGYAASAPLRFYLERLDPATLMLTPYSLNEFPRVLDLAKQKAVVRILVVGVRLAETFLGDSVK